MITDTNKIKTREIMCGTTKVKAHKRKGRIVKAHTRKVNGEQAKKNFKPTEKQKDAGVETLEDLKNAKLQRKEYGTTETWGKKWRKK